MLDCADGNYGTQTCSECGEFGECDCSATSSSVWAGLPTSTATPITAAAAATPTARIPTVRSTSKTPPDRRFGADPSGRVATTSSSVAPRAVSRPNSFSAGRRRSPGRTCSTRAAAPAFQPSRSSTIAAPNSPRASPARSRRTPRPRRASNSTPLQARSTTLSPMNDPSKVDPSC